MVLWCMTGGWWHALTRHTPGRPTESHGHVRSRDRGALKMERRGRLKTRRCTRGYRIAAERHQEEMPQPLPVDAPPAVTSFYAHRIDLVVHGHTPHCKGCVAIRLQNPHKVTLMFAGTGLSYSAHQVAGQEPCSRPRRLARCPLGSSGQTVTAGGGAGSGPRSADRAASGSSLDPGPRRHRSRTGRRQLHRPRALPCRHRDGHQPSSDERTTHSIMIAHHRRR